MCHSGPRSPGQKSTTQLLAHVLVHEITHILQGITRHSETGIMKAHWTPEDYEEMQLRPLSFTRKDIELIQIGLASPTSCARPNSILGEQRFCQPEL